MVARNQMLEQLPKLFHMPVEIHHHESVELKEAWIDITHEPGIGKGNHLCDHVAPKPFDAAPFCQAVHSRRVDSRVDRTTHQNHGARRRRTEEKDCKLSKHHSRCHHSALQTDHPRSRLDRATGWVSNRSVSGQHALDSVFRNPGRPLTDSSRLRAQPTSGSTCSLPLLPRGLQRRWRL